MRQAMRLWMKVTFYILIWVVMFNLLADIKASQYLRKDLITATHDASLMLDPDFMSQGKLVFDKGTDLESSNVYQAFINSLEYNTGLEYVPYSSSLETGTNSFQQDDFRIVEFELIDEENYTFPYIYSHPTYEMEMVLSGPTVIAVVETYGPRYFAGNKTLIRRAASYSYKK